jgi:Ca2+-binding EF-hand superfamily protein
MPNFTQCNKGLSDLDAETVQHLPKSFQLMVEIEKQAQEKVNAILRDVAEGKITLEEVKRLRGIVSH